MVSFEPVRVGSASGAVMDLPQNLSILAKHAEVDFIIGDWMSEYNMTKRGAAKASRREPEPAGTAEYEDQFVESLEPALEDIQRRGIRLAVNAGASDAEKLYGEVTALIHSKGLSLKVAWIEGDEVFDAVQNGIDAGHQFTNITTGENLSDWEFDPIYAQGYLGCCGIVEALRAGADIVICGRVADAAPTMAAAAFWHGWSRTHYAELAHSLIAGHLIECSFYVTGGNFSGFKSLAQGTSCLLDPPIAHIFSDGTFEVRKHESGCRSGQVTRDTCRSQLLYELQGKRYYNSDVVALVDQITIEEKEDNVVLVKNIGFDRPPPTTKIGMTAHGGFQAEVHYFFTGLDIQEKAVLLEKQLRTILDTKSMSLLKFTTTGSAATDPASQDLATVDFRVFAQSRDESALSSDNFLRPCFNIVMSTYPGATFATDARQALPKPYLEYFVTILPQALMHHRAHLPGLGLIIDIPAPTDTVPYICHQDIEESATKRAPDSSGPFTSAPMGYVVHARSGDKGSDCNVGFYVRYEDEYEWLCTLLTTSKIMEMLGKDYKGGRIERFELPNIQGT
ncbi:hypothetical protein QM012_002115 [Aureobasidium pullulans]|uniref:DUF1446-domain-containing protein n=1 Tax=Aureobasidium pullulans TaxID=5580 RepID=A0ABR0TCG0_AURPU